MRIYISADNMYERGVVHTQNTLVRSRQSTQLTRNTAFCSDINRSPETQKNLAGI